MAKTYKMTKINVGIYIVTFANGAKVRIERYPDGLWNTFLITNRDYAHDSYMQTYCTRGDALAELIKHEDELV